MGWGFVGIGCRQQIKELVTKMVMKVHPYQQAGYREDFHNEMPDLLYCRWAEIFFTKTVCHFSFDQLRWNGSGFQDGEKDHRLICIMEIPESY